LNKKAKELLLSGNLHRVSAKCCTYLKKRPTQKYEKQTGLKAILGVKASESIMRKNNYKSCFTKDKKFTPLYDLTDELEDEIYKQFNIEIPKVYDFITRTGCMGCPYGSYAGDTEKELALLDDNQRNFVCEYFKESYEVLGINTDIQMKLF
jgi:3'-phosphoadenosine 5'-phosphosulfate sulfotransferase (PAPS reductase)/FAD synthetase